MKNLAWILSLTTLAAGFAVGEAAAQAPASAGNSTTPAAATQVKIENFSFAPQTITVPVGAAVHWLNRDDIPHTVVSEDKSFKSKVLDTDDGFTHTFSHSGTYTYYCSLHPRMTARVVVR